MSTNPEQSGKAPSTNVLGIISLIVLGGLIVFAIQTLAGAPNRAGGAGLPARTQAPVVPAAQMNISEAVSKGDAAAVKAAAAAGADVNGEMVNEEPGRDPVPLLCFAAHAGSPDVLKAMLDAKAKTEVRTSDGRTALMWAASLGDAARVRMLLDAGARTDARADKGWTALMWAAARGEPASVKALIDAGADVNATNRWRQTALMHAARTGNIDKVNMLIDAGASATATDVDNATTLIIAASAEIPPAVYAILVRAGAPINHGDIDGVTALMKAAERGDAEGVQTLLKLGADKALKDRANQWTAADWAQKRDDERGKKVVELLKN